MEKAGIVTTDNNESYHIYWFKRENTEVIAVIDDIDEFKFLQLTTYKAFYSNIKFREKTYNVNLINNILRTLLTSEDTEESQSVGFNDKGDLELTIKYTGRRSGQIKREIKFRNGDIISEEYNDKYKIIFNQIDPSLVEARFTPFGVFDKDTVVVSTGLITNRHLTARELVKLYDLDHLKKYDFRIARSEEEADELMEIYKSDPYRKRSIDFETTGLDNRYGGKAKITGIVLGVNKKTSFYFPVRQDKFKYNLPLEWIEKITNIHNNLPEDIITYAHYSSMELKQIYNELGVRLRVDRDTFVLSLLADPGFAKGLHSLKDRAYQATGDYFLSLEDICVGGEIRFNEFDEEVVLLYACPDGTNTLIIAEFLEEMILHDSPKGMDIIELESKMLWLKTKEMYWGLRFDYPKLLDRINESEYILEQLETYIKKCFKMEGNVNSSNYKRRLFYEVLGLTPEKFTDTGLAAIDAKTLKYIKINNKIKNKEEYINDINGEAIIDIKNRQGKAIVEADELRSNKCPATILYLAYAKQKKLLGDYKKLIKKSYEDIFEFTIFQNSAKSGRQISDAHQFSKELKELIIADSDEHDFVAIDYAQIELRVLAGLYNIVPLLDLMKNHYDDIHRAFTKLLTGKEIWAISEAERKSNKAVSFGVVYLMAAITMANNAVANEGRKATEEEVAEAKAKIDKLFEVLPQMTKGIAKTLATLRETGRIVDMFGRCGKYSALLDPLVSDRKKSSELRSGNNMTIQGPAASIMKMAEINCDEYIISKGWDKLVDVNGRQVPLVRVIVSVHDELLISKHKSIPHMEVVEMLKECMEFDKIPGFPTFFCSPSFGDNWDQAKSSAYELPIELRDRALKYYKATGKSLIDFTSSETYIRDVNNYRKTEILNYMDTLYVEGMSETELAKKVRHPAYTHMLIDAYCTSKKGLSHEQCIEVAVSNYLKDIKGEEFQAPTMEDDGYEYNNEDMTFITDDKGELVDIIDETPVNEWWEEEVSSRYLEGNDAGMYYIILGDLMVLDLTKINMGSHPSIYDWMDEMFAKMNHVNEGKRDYRVGVVVDMASLNIISTDYIINYDQIEKIVNYIKEGGKE